MWKVGSFFPELERSQRPLTPRKRVSLVSRPGSRSSSSGSTNPCEGCPNEQRNLAHDYEVRSTMDVADPLLFIVGPGISEDEFGKRLPVSDEAGQLIRQTLADAGIDPARCIFGNTTRCHPPGDAFDTPEHKAAEKKCQVFLRQELSAVPQVPVLLLGQSPLRIAKGDGKVKLGGFRGLWINGWGHECFVVRHPDQGELDKFRSDIRRMASRMLGTEPQPEIDFNVYDSPAAAAELWSFLATTNLPWAFDIEAYDAATFPSRQEVAVDPCHPDWRLRGIAFAWGPGKGAYVDCKGWEERLYEAREYMTPAFLGEAPKWAFHGNYDEEGLVYNGWVPEIRYREGDGMLAMIALGDGEHESLKLEKAVVDILKKPQYWSLFDKSKMRDADIQLVARGSVGDACYTLELCEILHGRLERGEYLEWGRE